jgi:predicted transcriptional regulator
MTACLAADPTSPSLSVPEAGRQSRQIRLTAPPVSDYVDTMRGRQSGVSERGWAAGATEALTSEDPATGLRAVRALRKLVEKLEQVHVQHARSVGWSWQDIADALGVTRQAVHKKHSTRD